jgi:hypothetical protein
MTVCAERQIRFAWIRRVVEMPERIELDTNGTTHYLARIGARDGRWLRVVAVASGKYIRVITVFFDRRLPRMLT